MANGCLSQWSLSGISSMTWRAHSEHWMNNLCCVISIYCLYVWHIILFWLCYSFSMSVFFSLPKMKGIFANILEWWAAAGRRHRVSFSVHIICISVCWCQYIKVCLHVYMLYHGTLITSELSFTNMVLYAWGDVFIRIFVSNKHKMVDPNADQETLINK